MLTLFLFLSLNSFAQQRDYETIRGKCADEPVDTLGIRRNISCLEHIDTTGLSNLHLYYYDLGSWYSELISRSNDTSYCKIAISCFERSLSHQRYAPSMWEMAKMYYLANDCGNGNKWAMTYKMSAPRKDWDLVLIKKFNDQCGKK